MKISINATDFLWVRSYNFSTLYPYLNEIKANEFCRALSGYFGISYPGLAELKASEFSWVRISCLSI